MWPMVWILDVLAVAVLAGWYARTVRQAAPGRRRG
jgi:hypothetical protein